MPPTGTPRVGTRILHGALWSYGSLAAVRLVTLAATAILARLLSPRDFGLVALALIFSTALDAMKDLGLNQALVLASDGEITEQADTAFCFTVLMGAGLAIVIGGLSPLAADFFHQPRLLALLAVLGLNLPLRSIGLTHYTLAQRRLDFRARTVAEVAEVVVRSVVGIALALAGLGPWSLVLGYVAGTTVWTIALWAVVPWRPSLSLRRARLTPLLRFGGTLTVVGVIGVAMGYVDNLFVGRVLGPAALGIYSIGFRIPEMLVVDLVWAVGLVLFPAFARLDGPALRTAMITASRYTVLLGLPIAVAMIALADPLVLALFGHRWHDAVPVIQLLSVGFVGTTIGQVIGNAYMAARRVDVMVKLALPQALLLIVLIAIFVHHGIAAVAGCQAAVRITFVAIGVYVSTRVLGLRARALWSAVWPPLAAAAGMAVVIVALEHMITSPWPTVLISSALGGAVYLGLAWLLAGDALPALWRLARAEP